MNLRSIFTPVQLGVVTTLFLSTGFAEAQDGDPTAVQSPAFPESAEESAVESAFTIGALLGGGFFNMGVPDDQPGEYTFLFGSALTGGGFIGGLSANHDLNTFVSLQADLLVSRMGVSGFAEALNARRDVTINEVAFRFALLPKLTIPLGIVDFELGIGPELSIGLDASVDETVTRETVVDEEPLGASTSTWLLWVVQPGLNFKFGSFEVPIHLRYGVNPAYPDRTADRFPDSVGPDDPGEIVAGYDYYLAGTLGIRVGF